VCGASTAAAHSAPSGQAVSVLHRGWPETQNLKGLLSKPMEQSPSGEAGSFSASKEIRQILWKPEVHYRVHNSSPPCPLLSHIIEAHELLVTLKFHSNIITYAYTFQPVAILFMFLPKISTCISL